MDAFRSPLLAFLLCFTLLASPLAWGIKAADAAVTKTCQMTGKPKCCCPASVADGPAVSATKADASACPCEVKSAPAPVREALPAPPRPAFPDAPPLIVSAFRFVAPAVSGADAPASGLCRVAPALCASPHTPDAGRAPPSL